MLPRRFLPLMTSLLMSILMVTVMTALITAINTGIDEGFFLRWGRAYLIAWPIAFSFIFLFARKVSTLAQRICSLDN